jgi:penicillin-binding protein 2
MLTAAVGNGGTRYKPIIVKSMQAGANGKSIITEPEMVGQLPVGDATLALVRQGLWAVVNESRGTAHASRLEAVDFSGKTGTAQVVGRKPETEGEGGEDDEDNIFFKDHAWFVAYAPSEHPRIAVAVIVEHGEHGSSAAAPVAREVIRKYLNLPEDKISQEIHLQVEERRVAAIRALEEQEQQLEEEAAEHDD